MANYTLVPVNTDEIRNHYGDAVCEKLVPYQPHLFDNLMWGSDNGKPTLVGGNVQLSDGSSYYLVTPEKFGFVVKKQYRENPDELILCFVHGVTTHECLFTVVTIRYKIGFWLINND